MTGGRYLKAAVSYLFIPVRQYCCVLQLVCSSVQTKLARPNYMLVPAGYLEGILSCDTHPILYSTQR
jgi:hypothetical protein